MQEHFSEPALLLIIAAAGGVAAMRLRQPLLIAYILVGIVVGPAVLGIVSAHDQIDLLAQMGISLGHVGTQALGLVTLVGVRKNSEIT